MSSTTSLEPRGAALGHLGGRDEPQPHILAEPPEPRARDRWARRALPSGGKGPPAWRAARAGAPENCRPACLPRGAAAAPPSAGLGHSPGPTRPGHPHRMARGASGWGPPPPVGAVARPLAGSCQPPAPHRVRLARGALAAGAGRLAGHAARAAPWLGQSGGVQDQEARGRTCATQAVTRGWSRAWGSQGAAVQRGGQRAVAGPATAAAMVAQGWRGRAVRDPVRERSPRARLVARRKRGAQGARSVASADRVAGLAFGPPGGFIGDKYDVHVSQGEYGGRF